MSVGLGVMLAMSSASANNHGSTDSINVSTANDNDKVADLKANEPEAAAVLSFYHFYENVVWAQQLLNWRNIWMVQIKGPRQVVTMKVTATKRMMTMIL